LIYEEGKKGELLIITVRNRSWVLHNPIKPVCIVRIAPTYKHMFKPYFIRCGTI